MLLILSDCAGQPQCSARFRLGPADFPHRARKVICDLLRCGSFGRARKISILWQLSYLCRGENNAEGAGDCSPWISGKAKRASAPGPDGQQSSRLDFVGLNRLRKNPKEQAKGSKTIPQGLKPVLYYQRVTARLKSCPDASCLAWGVFLQPVKPSRFLPRMGSFSAACEALTLLASHGEFFRSL